VGISNRAKGSQHAAGWQTFGVHRRVGAGRTSTSTRYGHNANGEVHAGNRLNRVTTIQRPHRPTSTGGARPKTMSPAQRTFVSQPPCFTLKDINLYRQKIQRRFGSAMYSAIERPWVWRGGGGVRNNGKQVGVAREVPRLNVVGPHHPAKPPANGWNVRHCSEGWVLGRRNGRLV